MSIPKRFEQITVGELVGITVFRHKHFGLSGFNARANEALDCYYFKTH